MPRATLLQRARLLLRRPIPPAAFYAFLLGLYAVVLGIMCIGYLMNWPIQMYDTDTWYHLNGGRYLLTHHQLPCDSFFSFVSPPRQWVNYFWLFQGFVYLVWSWFGYYGLIGLRAALFLGTLVMVAGVLFHHQSRRRTISWSAFLFVCYCVLLLWRFLNVRPHMVTYLFIAAFLWVLECRPRWAPVLPVLAVLWSNLHGVAYPVMLLIVGAYAVEALLHPAPRAAGGQRAPLRWVALVVLSIAAILVTPHGWRLLRMPLMSTTQASHYVRELVPLTPFDLLSCQITFLTPSHLTFFNVLLVASVLAVIAGWWRKTIRLSHVLLWLGGLLLLSKGIRFVYECALLTLPLLNANPPVHIRRILKSVPQPVELVSVGLLMVMPLQTVLDGFPQRPTYPFSTQGLPHGVVTFLNRFEAGGALLNHPNSGGYLQWTLYPRYKIFMDMEVPFLFTDEDMYIAVHVFSDEAILREVLSTYDPPFITAPITADKFPELIALFPAYVPIFFDDVEVLFVDREARPAIAAQFALHALDPFQLAEHGAEKTLKDAGDRAALRQEARRIVEVDPGCVIANELLVRGFVDDAAYDQALPFAEAIIQGVPDSPVGYRLKGEALKGLTRFDEAIACYRVAFERSAISKRRGIAKQMGLVYFEQQRYRQAYKALRDSVEVFSGETSVEELYKLAIAALRTGRREETQTLLGYMVHRSSADDAWVTQLNGALRRDMRDRAR